MRRSSGTDAGEVMALYPLMPDRMAVTGMIRGMLYYEYTTSADDAPISKGSIVRLKPSDVLHIPGLGFDGLVGYSPIAMAKNAIGLAIATEEYGSKFFANGAQPAVCWSIREPSRTRRGCGILDESVRGARQTATRSLCLRRG